MSKSTNTKQDETKPVLNGHNNINTVITLTIDNNHTATDSVTNTNLAACEGNLTFNSNTATPTPTETPTPTPTCRYAKGMPRIPAPTKEMSMFTNVLRSELRCCRDSLPPTPPLALPRSPPPPPTSCSSSAATKEKPSDLEELPSRSAQRET